MSATSVLVVEDEAVTAMEIQSSLVQLGYQVTALAASGQEAIRSVTNTSPDIILMDIRLKGEQDGIETAIQLREQYDIPVVYLTAHSDEPTLNRAKQTSPYGYLLKPFNDEDLQDTLEIALQQHQTDRNLREQQD